MRREHLKLESRWQGQAAGQRAHALLHQLLDAAASVVAGGDHKVLDHALVVGLEERSVDLDLARLVLAVDGDLDQPGARAAVISRRSSSACSSCTFCCIA